MAFAYTNFDKEILFDFDGDGSSELVLTGNKGYHEGERYNFGAIVTAPSGKVDVYAKAGGVLPVQVEDVDHDGRPDLLTDGGYRGVVVTAPGSGFDHVLSGPSFLAHSLGDGTFSMNDAVAKKQVQRTCPKLPEPLVPFRPSAAMSDEELLTNVVCARMRGMKEAEIMKNIGAAFRALPPVSPEASSSSLWPSKDGLAIIQSFAHTEPPFTCPNEREGNKQ